MTADDPRRLATEVDLDDLVESWASGFRHPFALVVDADETRFPCPQCGAMPCDFGGAAVVLDDWRWTCWRCRFEGTRMMLERLVLEDVARLARLYEIVADREVAR